MTKEKKIEYLQGILALLDKVVMVNDNDYNKFHLFEIFDTLAHNFVEFLPLTKSEKDYVFKATDKEILELLKQKLEKMKK